MAGPPMFAVPMTANPPLDETVPPQIGSLEIFWPLIEPILAALAPCRVCEVGVDTGELTARLLTWMEGRGDYIGIDPSVEPSVRERFFPQAGTPGRALLQQTSLAALPALGRCDAYFLDGDHNHHTVSHELRLIAAATRDAEQPARGSVIFAHDVAWPWGRRDMYYLPTAVPAEARQPWSETLGVATDRDDLIDGGLREPGRYAVALRPGGARNGVLTAVEDFLASGEGEGWTSVLLPVAYGLAILYRPDDPSLPAACRERLEAVRTMAATGGSFLRACEENYLRLYFFGEYARHQAATQADAARRETQAHCVTLSAYEDFKRSYNDLERNYADLTRSYDDLLAHSHALDAEFHKLLAVYEELREQTIKNDGRSPQSPGDQFE